MFGGKDNGSLCQDGVYPNIMRNRCIYNDKFVQSCGIFMKKHYICTNET